MSQTAVLDLQTEAGFQAWVTQSASPQRASCTFPWSGLLFKTMKAGSLRKTVQLSMHISSYVFSFNNVTVPMPFGLSMSCKADNGHCLYFHVFLQDC